MAKAQSATRVSRAMVRRTPIGDAASPAFQAAARALSPQYMSPGALARAAKAMANNEAASRTSSVRVATDNLKNFVAALGTRQDKRSHSFYAFPLTLTRVELENMFRSSWLAKRIVRTPADDMTRAWVERKWDGWDKPGDNLMAQLRRAEKQFNIRGKVNDALTWGRLYGGAGIVLDIKGQEDWSQPLDIRTIQKGQLRNLHVLDRWRLAATGELDEDRRSPNYGKPKFFTISGSAGASTSQYLVHWTRILKFEGEPLPWFIWIQNAFWDDSVLQHVAEVIRDYDATMAGIASLVYEASVDIITSPGLAQALTPGGQLSQQVVDRYAALGVLKSINHMMVLDGGKVNGPKDQAHEEWQQKTTTFAGLKDVAEKFMVNVCGAADIPMTRLFGQSPAGLTATGESDIRNYYDRLDGDRERVLRHPMETLDEVLLRHLSGDMPTGYELDFGALWQVTDKERAEIQKLNAERDQIYLVQGAVLEHVIAEELRSSGVYKSMTEKDVQLIAHMAAQAILQPPPGKPGQPATKKAPTAGAPTEPGGGGPPSGQAGDTAGKDYVRKEGGKFVVYAESGRKMGTYNSRAEANERLRQIEAAKAAKGVT